MKNRGIYRTVGSGTVTQANMKLSGVDGGATASGGAFVDFGYKYSSDFSAGVDGWTGVSGTVTGNIDSIGGEDNWLRFTVNNVSGEHSARKSVPFVIGKRYNITIKYYIPSGQTAVAGFVVAIGGYAVSVSSSFLKTQDTVSTYSINFVAVHSGALLLYPITSANSLIINDAGGDDVFYIKDVKVEEFPPTSYLGHLLKITDSAGKSIIGYTKSAMAGESLDTEIATGTLTALKLYKITATEVNHFGTGKVVGSYFTSTGTETCNANNKVQQVLVGAATGVTIVSAQDGTQYNWFNKNSAFNWNDASGYTYQIIQENGKVVSTNNTYMSNFSAGVDGWGNSTGTALAGNIDGIGGQDNVLRVTCDTSDGYHYFRRDLVHTVGRKSQVTFKVFIPSTNSIVTGIRLRGIYWGSSTDEYLYPIADTWTTYTKVFTPNSPMFNLYLAAAGNDYTFQDAGGDDVFYIKDVVITELNAATTVTSGTLHLDASNTAMFFHDSIDFSSYAGTDAGSTPYLLCFYDYFGYMASAYGGAVGAGEGLDSEAITDWTNISFNTLTVNANGHDLDAIISNGSGAKYAYTNNSMSLGKLYKIVLDITLNTGTAPRLDTKYSTGGANNVIKSTIIDQTLYYTARTLNNNTDNGLFLRIADGTSTDSSLLISQKALTDVPVTGLHLFTTKNGTTRGMATWASSFNPNMITSVKIYRAY